MPQLVLADSSVFAQANPAGQSILGWGIGALSQFSLSSFLILICGLLIFGGACRLLATRRPSAVLAAYLVVLPLPMFIAFFGITDGQIRSLSVIANTPGISLTTADIAGATASSLALVLFAMLISAPSYLVIAFGLLARTLGSPTDSTPVSSPVSTQRAALNTAGEPNSVSA